MEYRTRSEWETEQVGERLGKTILPGTVIAFTGDLGAGKTAFTRGLAQGLEIRERVTSPTFTIVQVYESGRLPFYHFDVYRIGDVEEMDEIGYEDYFYGNGLCIVEWAERIRELIPPQARQITIAKNLEKGFAYRMIQFDRPL